MKDGRGGHLDALLKLVPVYLGSEDSPFSATLVRFNKDVLGLLSLTARLAHQCSVHVMQLICFGK